MPVPNRDTAFDFLIISLFGEKECNLSRCIKRAYLDLSRTLRDISKNKSNPRLDAEDVIRYSILSLGGQPTNTQLEFDEWHRRTCVRLKKIYADAGYSGFTIGQAQKWINMTMKYIYVMGDKYISGYDPLYKFCHTPLDERILTKLRSDENFTDILCLRDLRWSKLDDYKCYLNIQNRVRDSFKDETPLDVDFRLWPIGSTVQSQQARVSGSTDELDAALA